MYRVTNLLPLILSPPRYRGEISVTFPSIDETDQFDIMLKTIINYIDTLEFRILIQKIIMKFLYV